MGFLDRPLTQGFRNKPRRFVTGQPFTLPSPAGGLNLRDADTELLPNQARRLTNLLPVLGGVKVRPGYTQHSTGMTSEVKSAKELRTPTTTKLITAANGNIWDASSATASSLASGYSEDRWQLDIFNGFMFGVNGTDTPWRYDGTTFAATGFTGSGLTLTDLINVAQVRDRLWLCEKDTADVWYGAIGAVTGTLTKFQLSQVAGGGFAQAIGSWSRDAGDGMDDLTVFVMSTGQIIVYQGDPASTFTLVGKYNTETPIGRQCLVKAGGELVVITRMGLVPLSTVMANQGLSVQAMEPWGKIANGIQADAVSFGNIAGWHGVFFQGIAYFNIPTVSGTSSKQYVLNLRNGAWGDYENLPISSMSPFANSLYFGGVADGKVWKHEGANDNGASIVCKAKGAFAIPGGAALQHIFTAARPKLIAQGAVTGTIGVDVDYNDGSFATDVVTLVEAGSNTPWGSAWGSAWGEKPKPQGKYFSITGVGTSVAVALQFFVNSQSVTWHSTDVIMKPGGTL